MFFVLMWIAATILWLVLFHWVFHVVYFGTDGCLKVLAKAAALGLFTAFFIAKFMLEHPFIATLIVIAIVVIIVVKKKSA